MTGFDFLLLLLSAFILAGAFFFGRLYERRRQEQASAAEQASYERPPVLAGKPQWIKSSQPQPGTAGFTIAAALNGVGCLGRSAADEPVFVLVARDRCASMVVRDWADMAQRLGSRPEKVWEARELADRMEQWREQHGGGKVPD